MINDFAKEVHQNSVDHGWWVDGDCMNDDCHFKPKDEPQTDCPWK